MDKIAGGCMILMLVAVVVFMGLLLYDGLNTEPVRDTGIVVDKEYKPAHNTTGSTVDAKGKVTTTTRYVSAKYILVLQTEKSGRVDVNVDEAIYRRIDIGFRVYYRFERGKVLGIRWSEKVTLEERR